MSVDLDAALLPGQTSAYRGKVRDVFYLDDRVVLVASDRISAFDHILPKAIPFKGAVLTGIATHFLKASSEVVPNWYLDTIAPNVAFGINCKPIKLEMVIRGYLAGHAWRTYRDGGRVLCGEVLPEGLKEGDAFAKPIITPATKADEGHDEDISKSDILKQQIVTPAVYEQLEAYTHALFELGTKMARQRGLLLVDTKYEFGIADGKIYLIDEVHTPDSSRFYIAEGYEHRQKTGQAQRQLSKEFVREWLMEHGFQGLDGQQMPEMPPEFVKEVSDRYIDLYERLTGQEFNRIPTQSGPELYSTISQYLKD